MFEEHYPDILEKMGEFTMNLEKLHIKHFASTGEPSVWDIYGKVTTALKKNHTWEDVERMFKEDQETIILIVEDALRVENVSV